MEPIDGFVNEVRENVGMSEGTVTSWSLEWEWEGITYRGECDFGHSDSERCPAETFNREHSARPPGHDLPHVPHSTRMGMLVVTVSRIG